MNKTKLSVLLVAISLYSYAQEDTLKTDVIKEVTITTAAKKYSEKKSDDVSKLPLQYLENSQVYTILPKELMQEQLVTDYQSALQKAPGLANVSYGPGSGGIGLFAYSRGFATYAGSIRNGTSTNFVTLADPFNTESIEVIKGPSGTLYGSTLISYGGLINRVTKKPYPVFGGEASYTLGNWNSSRMTVDVNVPVNDKFQTRLNLLYQKDGSFQDYGLSKNFGIAPSFSYKINDRFTVNLDAEIYNTDRNSTFVGLNKGVTVKKFSDLGLDPKFSYASNDIRSQIKAFNVFLNGKYQISSSWVSNTLVSVANSDNNTNYLFLLINKNNTINRNYMYIPSNFDAQNIQQNFVGDMVLAGMRHRMLVGFDYSRNASTDNRFRIFPFDVVKVNETPAHISYDAYHSKLPQTPFYSSKKDWRTTGIYVTDVVDILDNLSVMASLRTDFFSDKGDGQQYKQTAIAPKFGVVFQPIKDVFSIFGNYQTGFKNVASTVNPTTSTVTDFEPEKARQMEGGIKMALLNKKLTATVSYYDIKVSDIVRPDPDNILNSIQDGERVSKGFEADVISSPINGLEVIMGYGYNDSKYQKAAANVEGKVPFGVPKHVGNFWVSYRVPSGNLQGIGLGIGGNFQSEMNLSDRFDVIVEGYSKYDASVFYENPKYRIGLKLNNFTNEEYFLTDAWGQFQSPRQFLANFTLKF